MQPGRGGDVADACVLPACVRDHQQQLLQQRQAMRAQLQQRKRDEVAAWARVQAQLAADSGPPAAAAGTLAGAADVADVAGRRGADQAGGADAAPAAAAAADLSCFEGRSLGTVVRNGLCPAGHAPGTSPAVGWEDAPLAGAPSAGLLLGQDDPAHGPDYEAAAAGGLGPAGLQRCGSAAVSVADDFSDVQSWAAWSTTSSINRCPRLEWWGTGAGQGRFSHRQQRQSQQLSAPAGGGGGGGDGGEPAGWWQRLLQRRQEVGRVSVEGGGGGMGQGHGL